MPVVKRPMLKNKSPEKIPAQQARFIAGAEPTRGQGRPVQPEEDRNVPVMIRLHPKLLARIDRAVKQAGYGMSRTVFIARILGEHFIAERRAAS